MRFPDISDEEILLVPMKIEGLIVGKEGKQILYGDTSVNFGMLAYTTLGEQMQAVPLSGGKPLEPGIHLHWLLPKGLTHGIKDAKTEEASYPPVPDRWLVTRIVTREEDNLETFADIKSFLVESNALEKELTEANKGSSTFPLFRESTLDYRYIGRSGEVWKLEEAEEYAEELTAAGYGELTFSANYQGCRNVFGFYDDLEDVKEGSITYQICGWYSKPEKDPLFCVDSEEKFKKRLSSFYWKLSKNTKESGLLEEEELPDKEYCTRILCHGTLCGMSWKGKEEAYDTGIPKESPRVAVGNSSKEAFAALLASGEKEASNKERLASVFVEGQMENWLKKDGVIESEEKIHEETFDSLSSKERWMLKRKPLGREEEENWELNWEHGCALDALNKKWKQIELVEEEVLEREKGLYDLWYKYTADKQKRKQEVTWKESCIKEMKLEAELIQELLKERKREKKEFNGLYERLLEMPLYEKRNGEKTGILKEKYQLAPCVEDYYFMPGEPVLLFAGSGMEDTYNKDKDIGVEQDKKLLCRVKRQLVTQFSLKMEQYEIEETISSDVLRGYLEQSRQLPQIIRQLILETLLLSTDWAGLITEQILKKHGSPVIDNMFCLVKEAVIQMQKGPYQAILHGENVQQWAKELQFKGIFPSKAAFQYYVPPWNPLYMEWAIDYTPDSDSISKEQDTLKKWRLEDIDYRLAGQLGYYKKTGRYKGRMLLTPHFMDTLQEVIQDYIDQLEEKKLPVNGELSAFLEKCGDIDMMSQRLNGFHDYFLMEHLSMQLPITCLWKQDEDMKQVFSGFSEKQKERCMEAVEEHVLTNPHMEGIFSPIRAGYGVITRLRLIDTFGRVQNICDETNYELQARAMACSESFREEAKDDKRIIFPPRIMQPVKLTAAFLSARDKRIVTNEATCTSPIIGWFVPDYMDGSLWVLDEKGKNLGRFTTVVDRKRSFDVFWVNAPDVGQKKTEERYELPKEVSGELAKLLNEFYQTMKEQVKEDSMVLYDFVNVLCNELCGMNKPGGAWKKDLLHFAKRPLALVQMGLKLETKQKPAKPKSWENSHISDRNLQSDVWNIKLPIRLGEGRKKKDGLAGFFKQGETTYDRFYTYHLDRREKEGFIRQDNEILISCMDEMEKNQFTLLMDPTLVVHLISGILPVKKVQLAPELVSKALGGLNMEIPVTPLLAGMEQVQAPYMPIAEKSWSWVQIKDGYYREEPLGKQPTETAFETNYPIRLLEGWLKLSE